MCFNWLWLGLFVVAVVLWLVVRRCWFLVWIGFVVCVGFGVGGLLGVCGCLVASDFVVWRGVLWMLVVFCFVWYFRWGCLVALLPSLL